MTRKRRSILAGLVFFAFTAPLGIAAHLISEFAGLGWHDDADLALSPRHAYLALIAVASIAALIAGFLGLPRGERRARIAELIESLPFRGRGARFTLVSFAAQFAFFAVTQLGEGCPLCTGDILVGVVAAAIAAAIGACAISLGKRRIIELVAALLEFFVAAGSEVDVSRGVRCDRVPAALAVRRTPFSFRYRPPPLARIR